MIVILNSRLYEKKKEIWSIFLSQLLIPWLCFPGNQSQSSSTVDGNLQRRDSTRRRASAHIPPKTNHLVISGGDGYEDFRLTNSSETVGRDDSTNHLLLWRVWDNRPWFDQLAPNPCPSKMKRWHKLLSFHPLPDSSLFGGVVLVFCSVSVCIIPYDPSSPALMFLWWCALFLVERLSVRACVFSNFQCRFQKGVFWTRLHSRRHTETVKGRMKLWQMDVCLDQAKERQKRTLTLHNVVAQEGWKRIFRWTMDISDPCSCALTLSLFLWTWTSHQSSLHLKLDCRQKKNASWWSEVNDA